MEERSNIVRAGMEWLDMSLAGLIVLVAIIIVTALIVALIRKIRNPRS